jgi:hypothetical protein
MALITGFPSSDFPAWVALNASMAWLKEKLFVVVKWGCIWS